MGLYNDFICDIVSEHCGWAGETTFQADAGYLNLNYFSIGDHILSAEDVPRRPTVGSEWDILEESDQATFWSEGLGNCPSPLCKARLHRKLIFENWIFVKVDTFESIPKGIDNWGVIRCPLEAPYVTKPSPQIRHLDAALADASTMGRRNFAGYLASSTIGDLDLLVWRRGGRHTNLKTVLSRYRELFWQQYLGEEQTLSANDAFQLAAWYEMYQDKDNQSSPIDHHMKTCFYILAQIADYWVHDKLEPLAGVCREWDRWIRELAAALDKEDEVEAEINILRQLLQHKEVDQMKMSTILRSSQVGSWVRETVG